jgi:YidC/Oxa1 family membrane protein insertase
MNKRRQHESKNMFIAMILSVLVIVGWNYYFEVPREKAQIVAMKAKAEADKQETLKDKEHPVVIKPREELIKEAPRVTIQSPSLRGSLSLKGLRFDDLKLAHYHETIDKNSPEVTLFSPAEDADGYFAEFGWTSTNKVLQLPTTETIWTSDGATLSPDHPVTLLWKNPDGITFSARITLDEHYLFTITQAATDANGKPVMLQTYAYINRVYDIRDIKKHPVLGIVHEGPLGVFDSRLNEATYKKLQEEKDQTFNATEGWLGVSDKYWLSAIIPPQSPFTAHFSYYTSRDRDHYQTDYLSAEQGQTTLHFFAGAKEVGLLDDYSLAYHIPLFERAVDFGFFYWLAEPIFHLLTWFHGLVGNFGIAILLLTVLVKLAMYPLASKSFVSMNQMKELQPKMKELQERYKNDKMEMNKAVMELYKREKVNPASGCLPMFIQIPVFFSLYKVLYVTIEMRHTPFFGWIHDLSASDPTNLFTLFGLIPWTPPGILHLGIWPILMCITMLIQQRQSPPPTDPTQAKMMKIMPAFFLFMFSGVAAGLVIYWTWSNTLSILQQWHIKRTYGAAAKKKKA